MNNTQKESVDNDTEDEAQKHQNSLSRIERFGLITAIIGLIADLIGLGTFVAGLWGKTDNSNLNQPTYVLFIIGTGLILIYAWTILTWFVTRRGVERGFASDLSTIAGYSTAGIGILLAPIAFVWFVAAFTGSTNPTQSQLVTPATITPITIKTETPIAIGALC